MLTDFSIQNTQNRIAMAMKQRQPPLCGEVTLVAASKTQIPATIEAAIASGLRCFGENRVQEAMEKWPALKKAHPDVRLHLIGPLQTNKVPQAVALFDVIESVDRPGLAEALRKEEQKTGVQREYFIQVNTGEEPQKSGVFPRECAALHQHCLSLGLKVTGLMCIPPADAPYAPHFALMHTLSEKLGLSKRSMGMSNDFEAAIRLGATHVRLGSALFGERDSSGA